jgi:hypothetical protein
MRALAWAPVPGPADERNAASASNTAVHCSLLRVSHSHSNSHHLQKPRLRPAAEAGALEVREGSHAAHEEYWERVSPLDADRRAAIGDWYLFNGEVRRGLRNLLAISDDTRQFWLS